MSLPVTDPATARISSGFPWFLLSLLLIAHFADRAKMVARRVVMVASAALLVFVTIAYVSGSHLVLRSVVEAVASNPHPIRTTAGIVEFSMRMQVIATEHFPQLLFLAVFVYLLLQTFCIPGTIALNVALGSLLGVGLGVPLCTLLGTVGASLCFGLSSLLGVHLVERADARLMKSKGLPKLRVQVARHRNDLFVFMLFLRLTPVLPNWLVNLASPVVGVPIRTFAGATLLGILPQTYLSVRFGALVSHALATENGSKAGVGSIVTAWDTLLLCVVALAVVAAARLRRRFQPQAATSSEVSSVHE